jgi:hypothetical protein
LGWTSGIVEIYENVKMTGDFNPTNNESHYFNYQGRILQPLAEDEAPEFDTVMYLSGHSSEYFQHFLDNGVPQISLMHFACGLDPSEITYVHYRWIQPAVPILLRKFGFKEVRSRAEQFGSDYMGQIKGEIKAKKLILPLIAPKIHPLLSQHFVDRMQLANQEKGDRVILVSRKVGAGLMGQRFILNEAALQDALRAKYGDDFEVFVPSTDRFEAAMELFVKASVVLGSHGGGLYNVLWGNRNTKLLEIMPVQENGVYPEQRGLNGFPSYCHLAFHTMATMNGHPYYRFYQMARALNYEVDIEEFLQWMDTIVK